MAAVILTPSSIRQDIVTRLRSKTAAGTRVYDSRRIAIDTDEVPCITVYSEGGADDKWATNSPLFHHTERIGITGIVGGADDPTVASNLDTLEDAILSTLATDTEWLAAFETITKIETRKDLDVESNRRLGGLAISIEVTYSVQYSPTLTDDLASVAVTTDSTDPDNADVSTRVIALEVQS